MKFKSAFFFLIQVWHRDNQKNCPVAVPVNFARIPWLQRYLLFSAGLDDHSRIKDQNFEQHFTPSLVASYQGKAPSVSYPMLRPKIVTLQFSKLPPRCCCYCISLSQSRELTSFSTRLFQVQRNPFEYSNNDYVFHRAKRSDRNLFIDEPRSCDRSWPRV